MKKNIEAFSCSLLRQPIGRRALFRNLTLTAGGLAVGLSPGCRSTSEKTLPADPVVETSFGKIRGFINNGIYSFRGVRYGASTEGKNRFMPPKPPEPWKEIRDASSYGYRASQTNPNAPGGNLGTEIGRILWASDGFRVPPPESEDCLFLNLWTPSMDPSGKRPVMVWLHGGGYSMGSSSDLIYDGTNLARRGAVVVGVNHRLNVFGYTHFGDIGGEEYAHSGNAGQLDIIAALKWVRNNIKHFGGDPDRVMIFGESGGGGKVCMLLGSPLAKDLFHSAVIQSGPSIKMGERDEATLAAEYLLAELGIKPANLPEIQKLPTGKILSAYFAANAKLSKEGKGRGFSPVLDPKVLPAHPFHPKATTISENIPVMVGWNRTEQTTFLLGQDEYWSLDEEGLRSRIEKLAGADTNRLIELYHKTYPGISPSAIYFHIASYSGMGSGSVTIAERKAALGKAPAYLYRLDWETPVLDGKLLSPHGLDLPIIFDNVRKGGIGMTGGGEDAQKMADQMSETWIAFAATGNPNSSKSGVPNWDPYDSEKRPTMLLNTESKPEQDPLKEQRLIFEKSV
jgi:para-nitrobenzyl esterase